MRCCKIPAVTGSLLSLVLCKVNNTQNTEILHDRCQLVTERGSQVVYLLLSLISNWQLYCMLETLVQMIKYEPDFSSPS